MFVLKSLKKNPNLVFCSNSKKKTGLHIACSNNYSNMIRILVDFNSNLHCRCINFRKPIDEAILYSKNNNIAINQTVVEIYD